LIDQLSIQVHLIPHLALMPFGSRHIIHITILL